MLQKIKIPMQRQQGPPPQPLFLSDLCLPLRGGRPHMASLSAVFEFSFVARDLYSKNQPHWGPPMRPSWVAYYSVCKDQEVCSDHFSI